ncbi:MDR family MFS transporter [Sphingopyxis sp. RIFCSPHIGHO2_12_FULL_65_19]|uniref:MDR family MFS transporter n=1 Tax=Sphingopyxis sp. RIFCSPHIGHO2_12_FULL_65_19 TaxID=1802172 RepID=UPI0008B247D2|nr:MDR family MFS transporter [Sphingopyxis sp. RIFCSPHIGHO2_12_FULL_65_19]OHD04521.1 MAG: EmrB/QacA family drug resistance transporter [Sphingopyxis sp. RIFCSPHIGHO2_12_FULL_65_19]
MASRALPRRSAATALPDDDSIPLHERVRYRGLLTVAVMGASIMQILDTTIANVAIPHMQSALGATSETVTWVLTSYILASAIAMPITGWLADRIGRRELFLAAIVGFIVASMACGAAQSLEQMVAFRFLQGISAAFIGPLSQSVMLDINPPERHARAMSIWGMGIMIGPILGPVLGGWLTESVNWRWVFYVNLPVGLITLAMMWALLPSTRKTDRRFDLFGFSMLALGLAALQLMLDRGAHLDWFDSLEIWIELGVAIACLWMFFVHMFTARAPLFSRAMLADRNLVTAMGFMIVIGIVMFASMALLPPMLQNLFGWPVIDTGIVLALRGVGILASMWVAGQLLGKIDARWLVGTGLLIAAYSLWQMSHWSLAMGMQPVIVSGLVQGLGMGLIFIPLNTMAFATIAPQHRTDGSSLLNLLRSLGASVGISVVTTLLGVNIQTSHEDLAAHVTTSSVSLLDPSTADRFGIAGDAAMAMVNAEINRQAAMIAYIDDFWLMMWVTLASVPLVLLLRPPKPGGPKALAADMGH